MADVHTKEQRSYNMSRIRGKDTKPEIILRKALWAASLRYRLKSKLPGKPDIVFPSTRIVVFVDGCFWHGCPVHMTWPKNNSGFWKRKIEQNISRDLKVVTELTELNWQVLRFWEHEISADVSSVVKKINQIVNTCKRRSPN